MLVSTSRKLDVLASISSAKNFGKSYKGHYDNAHFDLTQQAIYLQGATQNGVATQYGCGCGLEMRVWLVVKLSVPEQGWELPN